MSEFSTHSDAFLAIALWIGIGSVSLTLLIATRIFALRVLLRRSNRREAGATALWRPILNTSIGDRVPDLLPVLSRRDAVVFLKLWVHLHASTRGSATVALNELGLRLRGDAHARQLLCHGNRAERLLGILALGYLRDTESWRILMFQVRHRDSIASMNAVWAMVQIDANRALTALAPAIVSRNDWPLSALVPMLAEVREILTPVLLDALPTLDPRQLLRALRIAEGLHIVLPVDVHSDAMQDKSFEVVAAGLRLSADPALLASIRSLALDPAWRVRLNAAKTLGRIGDRSDIGILLNLLQDVHWWVRYRAAEALASLPFLDSDELDALVDATGDRFSGDSMRQVRAEAVPA